MNSSVSEVFTQLRAVTALSCRFSHNQQLGPTVTLDSGLNGRLFGSATSRLPFSMPTSVWKYEGGTFQVTCRSRPPRLVARIFAELHEEKNPSENPNTSLGALPCSFIRASCPHDNSLAPRIYYSSRNAHSRPPQFPAKSSTVNLKSLRRLSWATVRYAFSLASVFTTLAKSSTCIELFGCQTYRREFFCAKLRCHRPKLYLESTSKPLILQFRPCSAPFKVFFFPFLFLPILASNREINPSIRLEARLPKSKIHCPGGFHSFGSSSTHDLSPRSPLPTNSVARCANVAPYLGLSCCPPNSNIPSAVLQ
ncbi:hypothetical protein QBC35DRAFT_52414 [Podospora australis]|uniref:Uncharacterized protein n=1 Tax=Podospora australis TaxID=1536484 RepID=A0AAN6WLW0_9PEZI|nr:hypothetical protein QBC35DRAFT_52414 [Podospora australis]